MTKLTILEAIMRSGVSRPTFNNRFVKTGLVTIFKENGTQYIKGAELTKALANYNTNTASTKKNTAAASKVSAKKSIATSAVITKATTAKIPVNTRLEAARPTEASKLKLQLKQLKEELESAATEKEALEKQVTSLKRKNTTLTCKLSLQTTEPEMKPQAENKLKAEPKAKTKPKPKATSKTAKLYVVEIKEKTKAATKAKPEQEIQEAKNESWVDKWWDSF